MEIGISTASFYPIDTYEALKSIAGFSVKTAEVFFNTFSELNSPYIDRLKKIADENNIKITSIHPLSLIHILKYMTENGYVKGKLNLYNEYYQVVNDSEMIKNLSLKYNIKHDDNTCLLYTSRCV